MRVTLTSTDKIVTLNGIPARIWQGQTESGAPIHAYVTRIACDVTDVKTQAEFERELQACEPPRVDLVGIPLRMII